MSCCGQKRQAERTPNLSDAAESEVMLKYLGQGAVRVVSPVSGKSYRFSEIQPIQSVSRKDAASILRTGKFRLKPIPE